MKPLQQKVRTTSAGLTLCSIALRPGTSTGEKHISFYQSAREKHHLRQREKKKKTSYAMRQITSPCRCELDATACARNSIPYYSAYCTDDDHREARGPVDWDRFFNTPEKSSKNRLARLRANTYHLASSCVGDIQGMIAKILFGSGTSPGMARQFIKHSQISMPSRKKNLTYHEKLAEEEARMKGVSQTPIGRWLAARNLQRYEAGLARMGVKRVADLVYLTDEDMDNLNVDPESRMHFYVRVIA